MLRSTVPAQPKIEEEHAVPSPRHARIEVERNACGNNSRPGEGEPRRGPRAPEWHEPDTYTLTLDDVRLALRHGHPCSTGIVVDAWPLLAQRRPDDLQSTAMRSAEAQRRVRDSPAARLMERVAPGWTQHGEELDAEIDASTLREVRKAEAEARSFFDAPVNDDLVAHWTRLGGQPPDPL